MTAKTRLQLASIFENGDIPTASGFVDLFDSFVNLQDTDTNPQVIQSGITVRGTFSVSGGLTTYSTANIREDALFYKSLSATATSAEVNLSGVQNGLIQSVNSNVSAAGNSQSTAVGVSAYAVVIKGGTAAQGVRPEAINITGKTFRIFNRLGTGILLYPITGAAIDGGTVNVATTISASVALDLTYVSATEAYTFRSKEKI